MKSLREELTASAPYMLAILRIVTALLFVQHGIQKVVGWPASAHHPDPIPLLSFFGVVGLIELVGGAFLIVGLCTRGTAFLLAGQMAIAYWAVHFRMGITVPDGWMPVVNGGDLAIQFCFVFLYLLFAGPGAWSIDSHRSQCS